MFQKFFRLAALAAATGLALACVGAQELAEPSGQALFGRHCASCHGRVGEGDGPVASVMLVSVPNLRTLAARAGGTFPRDAVMQYIDGRSLPAAHGERLMPVWGDTFSGAGGEAGQVRDRIAAITDFVERLQN